MKLPDLPCWLWTVLIFLTWLIFLVGIIISYVVVKPQGPTFTLDHVVVNNFNLTSDGHLTAFFDIILRAQNPNHWLKLEYESIQVSVFKDKQNLASDTFPGFKQRKHGETILHLKPVSIDVPLKEGPKFDFGIESGMGHVIFDIFLTSLLNSDNLEVYCDDVMVNLTMGASKSNIYGQNSEIQDCGVLVYSTDAN